MKRVFFILLSAIMLSGCSSVSVRRDYDEEQDYSELQRFAWKYAVQPETGNARVDNDLLDERVRRAVEQTLTGRGFAFVEKEAADFLVAYFVNYDRRLSSGSMSLGFGSGSYGRYGGVGYNTGVSDYDQVVLRIDIIDPADDKTIWRGTGRRNAYDSTSPKKITKRTNETVQKILKKFPPIP